MAKPKINQIYRPTLKRGTLRLRVREIAVQWTSPNTFIEMVILDEVKQLAHGSVKIPKSVTQVMTVDSFNKKFRTA